MPLDDGSSSHMRVRRASAEHCAFCGLNRAQVGALVVAHHGGSQHDLRRVCGPCARSNGSCGLWPRIRSPTGLPLLPAQGGSSLWGQNACLPVLRC